MDGWATWVPWALLVIGSLGIVERSVHFVRVTMPYHYGSNPGFGAYETSCLPWWLVLSIGAGLVTSPRAGVVLFVVGLFGLGLVAQFLGRVFGN